MPSDPTATIRALLDLYATLGKSSRTTRQGAAPVSMALLSDQTGIPFTRLQQLRGTYRKDMAHKPLSPVELRALGESAEQLLGVPALAISRALVGLDSDEEARQVAEALGTRAGG